MVSISHVSTPLIGHANCPVLSTGTIIEIEQRNLRAAGAWIKDHGEAIFNTTYWFVSPEEGAAVRFTQGPDAFYITTLYAPNDTLVLASPVPYVQGDQVTVVGGNMSGAVVPSDLMNGGSLRLNISEAVKEADEYAWVFKISYAGGNVTDGRIVGPVTTSDGLGKRWPRRMPVLQMITAGLLVALFLEVT